MAFLAIHVFAFFQPARIVEKRCLGGQNVSRMRTRMSNGPSLRFRGSAFWELRGGPFWDPFRPFFKSPFDFCESLKRYENRHLSVFEPSEGAFFGSFRRVDFPWKKTPRCFVYRHFSDFRYLRKDVFWGESLIILTAFGG